MLYRQIILEWGQDTESGVWGLGYSPDNGKNFYVLNTTHGRKYRAEDGNRLYPYISDQVQDKIDTVVAPAKSAADSAQSAADAAIASAQVTSDAVSAIASATAEAKQGANDAMSRAKSAWDVAIGAKEAVTNFDPLLKSTQSDASNAIAQIADTASALSDAKTAFNSYVAEAKELASTAQTTADSAVAVASDARSNATVAIQTASQASMTAQNASGQAASAVLTANGALTTASDAKSDATVAVQTASGASLTATNAQGDATIAKQTASEAKVQASNAESDFAQLSIRANKIEANVANNSGAIASVQQTATGLTTTVAKLNARDGINLLQGTSATENEGPSDFSGIVVTAGDSYTFSGFMSSTSTSGIIAPYIQFYDGSGTKLKEFAKNSNVPVASGTSFVVTGVAPTNSVTARVLLAQSTGSITINYRSLKFEHGSQATPWTPAPTDASVGYNSLKVTVDQTSDIINDPKTGLNATYQTATGNATTISNVKGDVTQLQTTASGLTSRVGNLESKTDTQQTAIEQNKNAITLKADQTNVDTLKGTVNQLQSSLTVQAGQIQEKVTSSQVAGMLTGYATQTYTQSLVTTASNNWNLNLTSLQTDVNAIKTTGGGVNLLTGTSGTLQTYSGSGWGSGNLSSTRLSLVPGQTYTAKLWIQGYDVPTRLVTRSYNGSGVLIAYAYGNTIGANSSGYSIVTWNADSNWTSNVVATLSFTSSQSATHSGQYKELMIEEGTVAHTWSPAPSDMATVTSVTNLSATVDGIQSQVYNSDGSSKITQLSNVIQTKVGTDDFNNLKQSVDLQTLDSADINNMKTNGHYLVHNLADNPIGGWVYVDVTGNGNDRIRQDVYQGIGNKHKYRRWVDTNWTDWEEGATYTEINQLQDAINLRVTKGDLISQINLQAGTSLIQSNKLVLDANTTVFTGDAFIPSAAIAELDADKLTFYGNGSKATIGASIAQYDDDKTKSTINLQYEGGIEIHSSSQQGSILTMHDNTIRLASKSWGDNPNAYQYSGFYAAPNYSLMNTYHRDGTTSGVAIDDNQIHIYGSSKDQQLGALKADVGWYSINGKTGSLTGGQISLKAGNTQAVLTDNNININNASDTNDKNYDVAIHIKGWAEMTGWFTCMGMTQTSLLSTKTRIEPLDTKVALDKIVSANVNTYQFKTDVAKGKTKRHASVIIDDVHDVAEYYTPEEFISENRMGRDDGDIIGYLMGAVQELKKQLDELKEKI